MASYGYGNMGCLRLKDLQMSPLRSLENSPFPPSSHRAQNHCFASPAVLHAEGAEGWSLMNMNSICCYSIDTFTRPFPLNSRFDWYNHYIPHLYRANHNSNWPQGLVNVPMFHITQLKRGYFISNRYGCFGDVKQIPNSRDIYQHQLTYPLYSHSSIGLLESPIYWVVYSPN